MGSQICSATFLIFFWKRNYLSHEYHSRKISYKNKYKKLIYFLFYIYHPPSYFVLFKKNKRLGAAPAVPSNLFIFLVINLKKRRHFSHKFSSNSLFLTLIFHFWILKSEGQIPNFSRVRCHFFYVSDDIDLKNL